MSRRIRCIAMTLALSALMAASVQAAPTRTLHKGSTPEVGLFAGVWELMVSWLHSTSHLDPNGNH
jgi:uncharacterized membrane protein YczE